MKPRLLVLQATSLCNLDCTYCDVPDRANAALMSEDTLRAALALGLSRHRAGDSLRILWHAGEPLAAGLAFYQRAAEIIRALTPASVRVGHRAHTRSEGAFASPRMVIRFSGAGAMVGVVRQLAARGNSKSVDVLRGSMAPSPA